MKKHNKINKKVYFDCLQIIRYQNAKMHPKPPVLGNETTLPETCLLSFLGVLGTKTRKKSMEVTLYANTKQNYEKRIF